MYVIQYGLKGVDEVKGALQRAGQLPRRRMREILNKWRFALASKITSNLTGGVVNKRTGNLLKTVRPHQNLTVVETSENNYLVTFKNKIAVYGVPLETGGTITPKSSRYLTIPLRQRTSGKPIPITRYKNKFFRPSKRNPENLIAYWRKTKNAAPVPIFVLAKKVELPEYPWFSSAVEAAIPLLRKIVRGEA